jgi:hypothetical protein
MQYGIYVQGKMYKTFDSTDGTYNFLDILKQVTADQASGELIIDPSQPTNVQVKVI